MSKNLVLQNNFQSNKPTSVGLQKYKISDAERSQFEKVLQQAFVDGRIDQAELEERLEYLNKAVYNLQAQKTVDELPLPIVAQPSVVKPNNPKKKPVAKEQDLISYAEFL